MHSGPSAGEKSKEASQEDLSGGSVVQLGSSSMYTIKLYVSNC